MFIVFEGLESSGKSTQLRHLEKFLIEEGHDVESVAEPGTTSLGQGVREIVLHQDINVHPLAELLLYEAARAQVTAEKILPGIEAGRIMLCDRYTLSSLAYQGHGRQLDLDKLRVVDAWATQNLQPDMTIYFDISLEEMRKRQGKSSLDRLEKEDQAFFERVLAGYLVELQEMDNTHILDGFQSKDVLFEAVKSLIKPLLDAR